MNLYSELEVALAILQPVRTLLVGGLAYSIYVQPRFTQDIDLMISEQDFESVYSKLISAGFLDQKKVMTFEKATIARCIKLYEKTHLILNFLLEPESHFEVLWNHRIVVDRGKTKLNLIGLEDLIELKTMRNNDQDKLDIIELKNVQSQ